MLKGSREGVLRQIRPISIHGQISWNVYFNDPEDLNGPVEMARVGPEWRAWAPKPWWAGSSRAI